MDVTSYTAPRKSSNCTYDEASNFMNEVASAGFAPGLALFGEKIGGGGTGSYMTPVTTGQKNFSAMWVDSGPSLADQGINPAEDRIYFQLWIETKKHYVCVGDAIRELKNNGNNIAAAVE